MAKHVAVFGNPSSGKSVFCAGLAKSIAKEGKRVIIISSDSVVPMLPFFCGNVDTKGLVELLNGEIDAQRTAQAVKVLRDYPMIGVIGFLISDRNKKEAEWEQVTRIGDIAGDLADVVIWDGISDLRNIFQRVALERSNLQIGILTPDLKGALYYENHKIQIQRLKQPILFEGMSKPYTAHEEMSNRIGGFAGMLPYSREIERICMEGDVFSVDKVCHSQYTEALNLSFDELFRREEA